MKNLINTANGTLKGDLVLKNGFIVNVFNGEIEKGDVAITKGVICGIGNYEGKKEIDCTNKYIMPSFIDAHMHIESTKLTPAELSKLLVPSGTTTLIADPHEIANVLGFEGIDYLYNESKPLPIDINFMLPSCVPATPFEDAGATITSKEIKENIKSKKFLGLGEFMNFPGVINADDETINKIAFANAKNKITDGHACDVSGKALNAYLASGIKTDHECTNVAEMAEKIARGMYIQVRQGTTTRNLQDLLPAINSYTMRRCLFCTDDKRVDDLIASGHLDNNIRIAIKEGLNPIWAITMATLNPAECYGLKGKGAIAPSYIADIAVVDNLSDFNVKMVFKNGKLVGKNKKPRFKVSQKITPNVLSTVNIKPFSVDDLQIKLTGNKAVVLSLLPKNVVTKMSIEDVITKNGVFDLQQNQTLNKLVVVERHKATGKIGLGLIKGYDIRNGAIATSVAHDSHNIIAVGDNDKDIEVAIKHLEKLGGGIVVVSNGVVLCDLVLDIAGLMSSKNYEYVNQKSHDLLAHAKSLGINENVEPFMSLSFLSLAVIPTLKITARGLFDVTKFDFINIDPNLN